MKVTNKMVSLECTKEIVEDFLSVSKLAAIASYPWIGRGNKNEAVVARSLAMRNRMNQINMSGLIVIGEGEMDEAPMLYRSEELGTGHGPQLDISVDPVEGANLIAKGQGNSLSVIAVTKKGGLLHAPDMYMKKIAVGPKAKGCINIDASLTENMIRVANALGKDIKELTVMIQDRPLHQELINQVFEAGARVKLFSDVDITGVIGTALDHINVDLLVGTGGAPEGVISAIAIKCLGGDFQAKLVPQNEEEFLNCLKIGIMDPEKVLTIDDIVKTDDCFFVATGITDGMLLKGVHKKENGFMETHSLVITNDKQRPYKYVDSCFFP